MSGKLTIAIDGPAGAGKSTVAKIVADKLGYLYIDTGAMYRALTLKVIRLGLKEWNDDVLTNLACNTEILLQPNRLADGQIGGSLVFLDGKDVTQEIRSPEVSKYVSLVAMVPGVRQEMVKQQRKMACAGGVVMDGRDIGTYVLPHADRKFFLTASIEERARRRYDELRQKGYHVDLDALTREIMERDSLDSQREVAPLRKAPDAILINTTGLTISEVAARILELCKQEE